MFDEVYIGNSNFSFRRWGLSLILAVVAYLALFYAISIMRGTIAELPEEEKKVDVDFVEEIVKKEEPKPVAPPPPVIPKDMKVVEVDKPIVQEQIVPTEVPDEAPKEADPSMDKGVAVYGKYDPGKADPLGVEGGKVEAAPEPVRLPEDAMPPQPLKDNSPPKYPVEARNRGVTGVVLLKIIIDAQGNVGKVEVLRGQEPFVSAAVEAVKKWKYKPAYYQNKPITIYHIIKIPFTFATG
jgi:protein TonB